ncbi:uncharacterized protein LOC141612036 [Silene latifolia]|uniref:uncharacterized protein LOC141612036 n=1 Tax=Silene latifolia TaxID=37657 RepID=UPI003D7749A3
MAFQCFYKRGPHKSGRGGEEVKPQPKPSKIVHVQLNTNWDSVTCPICLDYPHNGVLLQCSSYEQGCRPFVCDTNHLQSNCLERFRTAYGMPPESKPSSTLDPVNGENPGPEPATPESDCKPNCPLCRGDVNGWVIIDEARKYLDQKKRCCEEERCLFVGTFLELQKHAQEEHPNSRPSRIDPARQLDWENFQQSSEIVDVLSTIHSEVPRGVVLGDYVIEYGDGDTTDDFEDFPGDEGNWWTSCILYQVFDNLRNTRNRRRIRNSDTRRGSRRSSQDTSNSDDGSVISVDITQYRGDGNDDEFVNSRGLARNNFNHRSSPRRRSRFNGH